MPTGNGQSPAQPAFRFQQQADAAIDMAADKLVFIIRFHVERLLRTQAMPAPSRKPNRKEDVRTKAKLTYGNTPAILPKYCLLPGLPKNAAIPIRG